MPLEAGQSAAHCELSTTPQKPGSIGSGMLKVANPLQGGPGGTTTGPSVPSVGPVKIGPQSGGITGPPGTHGPAPMMHQIRLPGDAPLGSRPNARLPRFGLLRSECTIGHAGQAPLLQVGPREVAPPERTASPIIGSPPSGVGDGSVQQFCVPNTTTGPGSTV